MYSLCNGYTSMYIHYVRYLFASGFLLISYIFLMDPAFRRRHNNMIAISYLFI
jgi:hypothetical protein